MLRGLIRIPGAQTKNGEPVRLPLFAVARDVLAGLPRSLRSQYVLTSVKGRRFNPYYENRWPELRDRMHEEDPTFPADFHWHDLRATGASWLTMAGISEQAIKAIMNIKGMFEEPKQEKEREG
jgi:integrase